METYFHSILWIVLIVIFGITEIATTQLVSIWFVGGSIAALVLSFFSQSLTMQITVFVLVSAVLLLFTRPLLAKRLVAGHVATNADMVIGKEALALSDMTPLIPGRVTVNGQDWAARCDEPVAAGSSCRILKIEGVTLTVVPVKEDIKC